MIPNRNISMEELSEHDTKNEEKWIAVEDVVFDVSNFKHPGGSVMKPHLGTSAVRTHPTFLRFENSYTIQITDGNIYGTSFLGRSKEVLPNSIVGKLSKTVTKTKEKMFRKKLARFDIQYVGDYVAQSHRTFKVYSDLLSPYLTSTLLIWIIKRIFLSSRSFSRRRTGVAFALLAILSWRRRYLYKIADTETEFSQSVKSYENFKTGKSKEKISTASTLWNGDHLTIASALLEPCLPRIDFEQCIHNGKVAVDVAHQAMRREVVSLPTSGVGGDSNSTYVRNRNFITSSNRLFRSGDSFERFR